MPAKLSTHVLDLSAGRPAAGLRLELWRLDPAPRLVKSATTNRDGRTDAPLLAEAEMAAGAYEIVFMVGDYFGRGSLGPIPGPGAGSLRPGRPRRIVPRPLLVTPWSYSTYRGS